MPKAEYFIRNGTVESCNGSKWLKRVDCDIPKIHGRACGRMKNMCNICMSKLPLHIRNNDMTFDPSRHHHCDSATFVDASRSLVGASVAGVAMESKCIGIGLGLGDISNDIIMRI